MKKLLLFFLVIVFCISAFIGCSDSETVNLIPSTDIDVFSQLLDIENFVPGISQGDFIEQMSRYRCGSIPITDFIAGFHYDGFTGGGYRAGGEFFGFENCYEAIDNDANYSNQFWTKVQLNGLELPYGIDFDDSLTEVLQKIGITVDPYTAFSADENSSTDMTLYRDNDESLVFKDMKRAQEFVENEMPYVLIYTETYATKRADGRNATVERTVKLSFLDKDSTENETDILGMVGLSVCEKYKRK